MVDLSIDAAASDTPWTVEELIEHAEKIMAFAPDVFRSSDLDSQKELNVRLIRDYVVRDFIPRPVRVGREARFGLDHLVHLLAVRALLKSHKWSLPAIKASFASTSMEELLDGVLLPVKQRITSAYMRSSKVAGSQEAKSEPARTPALNPAQLLIEQFKGSKTKHLYRPPEAMAARMSLGSRNVDWLAEDAHASSTKLHLQLEPGCELVIDERRVRGLKPEEIDNLGEALKRLLNEKRKR
jgi:hypothetical protein